MPRSLYLKNIPPEITKEKLVIYFQSSKSGGGDVDTDASVWNGDNAMVVFEEEECLVSVLNKTKHEIDGHQLEISDQPFKPKPIPRKRTRTLDAKKEKKIPPSNEKAYLGEVRTVIVSGLSPHTTDEGLEMFFENSMRTGGGEIAKLDRCQPDVAHITYASAEVAARVLKNDKLELDGYLLKLKEKQPELFLPPDRMKLYVENINPKTTKDSLSNYIEVRAKVEVCDVEYGENGSALVMLNEEADVEDILKKKKPLEGAVLKISNPPVCNSILVTGLTKNTTKNTIEMYFDTNERSGGGKIYGDVIHQKNEGKAVISFCDPQVVQAIIAKEQKLDGSVLDVRQHYQFMKRITEIRCEIVKVNTDILDHAVKNYDQEIRDRFGDEILKVFNEKKEELIIPSELAEDVEEYVKEFTVKEIQFCKKLLDTSSDKLKLLITKAKKENIAIEMQEDQLQIQLVGKKKYVDDILIQVKNHIAEMEKDLNVVTEHLNIQGCRYKLELFLLHEVDEMIKNEFDVDVNIEPTKEAITIKGRKENVSLATKGTYKNFAQITDENIDINETAKRFITSGGLELLNNGMKATGLKGLVSVNQLKRNKAKILFFNEGTYSIEDVYSYLNTNMFVKEYDLDEESHSLLKSNKWKKFCEDATKETSVGIYPDERSSTKITLVGKKSEVEEIYEALQEFMKRNTIVKESRDLDDGYVEYLVKYCAKDLEEIEKKLEEHSVRLRLLQDEGTLNVHGTKEGVKKAIKEMQNIISSIATDKMNVDKSRNQDYLESDGGKFSVAGIETKHKCLIRLIKVDGEKSTIIPSTAPKQALKLLCSYETQENISLKVFKDDITVHGCDVIVNAANGDLNHVGGVARSILDAGGEEIQKECDDFVKREGKLYDGECFSGRPGKLPCKRLIHAVGPRWDDSRPGKTRTTLRVTCATALEEAKDCRSIAIPAIGSGIYGIPKDICADIMIEAAEEFSKKYDNCALKEIHFVNIDDATSQVFLKKFREKFGRRPSFKDSQEKTTARRFTSSHIKEKKREDKDVTPDVLPKRKPGDFITTKDGMKISVAVGDLSTYKADILVNTTGENLQLDSNPCSKALSNEAGPTLQAECTKIGKLEVGQVAATLGGNLLCDEVYHVVCVQWNDGGGEQVLRNIIKNCLNKGNSSGKKSIAFPAIGTGILGFPHDVAAKIFFEETKEFEKRIKNCTIKEVSFVVYNQDTKSTAAFKNELKKQAEWSSSVLPTTVPVGTEPKKSRKKRRSTKNYSPSISKSSVNETHNSVMCIQVGEGKNVEIVKGDITKETTDVIAHLTNPGMSLQSGVAKALTKAGGQNIERECQDIVDSAEVEIATTFLTTAEQLSVKYIAHMVASNGPSFHEIEKCISNCLEVVSERECESISFPAVGTGSLNQDPEKAATAILTPVMRFLEANPGPLKNVRIVLKDNNLVTAFQTAAKKFNEDEEPGMFKRLVNLFWKSDSTATSENEKAPVIRKELFLKIYARDEVTVSRVKENLVKVMESQNTKRKIENDNIEKLSQRQINEIKSLCEMNDIKVTIDKRLNRIVVTGHGDDVSKILSEIFKYLSKIGEEEKEKERAAWNADLAEIVSQGVQWFYVDPTSGDHEEYDSQTNVIIEKAYSKKEKSVIFLLDDGKCEIVFEKMEESNLDNNETIKVIRKDLKEVSVPEYWEAQPVDTNGKELTVHLAILNPNDPKHKEEYKKINDHFEQTANQHQIEQIQRIQNPSLFREYLMKKRSLDEKSGSNEMYLFHGTTGNNLNAINEKGLNRSYAGINGTAYGKGVYFAREASLSAGYAKPMPDGKKYMYYTKAAVGQYTIGDEDMIVPPSKGGNSNDSYDSTVNSLTNPTIFVLYHDSQNYPEYLITFK